MLKTWDVLLSGIEITRINPAPATWTASLDVSLDNGATWSNIATGLALDRLGAGSFALDADSGDRGHARDCCASPRPMVRTPWSINRLRRS